MDSVDFLSELPCEVLEHVLSFVEVVDTLKCLGVCKRWNSVLNSSRLERFWKNVCLTKLGLTKAKLENYHQRHSFVKIVSSVVRHQRWVKGFMSKIDQLDRGKDSVECHINTIELFQYPRLILNRYRQDNMTRPSCFIGHHFVLCSPLFIRESHLIVATVSTMTKTTFASSHDPLRMCLTRPRQSWVFWVKASINYILILIQPEGRWIGYCPLTARIVLDVENDHDGRVLLSGGCAAIACCEDCFQVVTLKAVNDEAGTWDLNVLQLGRPPDDDVTSRSCEVLCKRSILVKLKENETVLEWKFLSLCHSNEIVAVIGSHYCSSHQLVCITNTKLHIYKCSIVAEHIASSEAQLTSPSASSKTSDKQCTDFVMLKVGEIVINDSPHHTRASDNNTGVIQISSFKSSLDGYLIGVVVHPCQLFIWDLHTRQRISSTNLYNLAHRAQGVGVDVSAPNPKVCCRLLAVGHLYAVVAVFDEKPGGQICIIETASGRLLTRRESRVQWRVHGGRDYIHLVNERWLSDIFCFNAPFFAYLNRSGSLRTGAQPLSCVQFMHCSDAKSVT